MTATFRQFFFYFFKLHLMSDDFVAQVCEVKPYDVVCRSTLGRELERSLSPADDDSHRHPQRAIVRLTQTIQLASIV